MVGQLWGCSGVCAGAGLAGPEQAKPSRPMSWRTKQGSSCCNRSATVTTVSPDPVRVESELAAGTLRCPGCGGPLAPWGWARPRPVGRGDQRSRVRPRRSICRGGVARSTVRGWLSRFASVAGQVRAHLVRWALWLAAGLVRIEPSGSAFGDAIVAIAVAGGAAAVRLGVGCRWEFASAATGGRSLCNTTSPSRDRGWGERSRSTFENRSSRWKTRDRARSRCSVTG